MRVFDFTLLSGYEFSGVDVAQGFRARLFAKNNVNAKFIFTELPAIRDMELYGSQKIKRGQIMSAHLFMTGRLDMSLSMKKEASLSDEITLLNRADMFIFASAALRDYYIANGLKEKPYLIQNIPDYMTDICANEHKNKKLYIMAETSQNEYPLNNLNIEVVQYDEYRAMESILRLSDGGFGLIWDADEQALGLYMAAGIPVIVKKGLSCEKYVTDNEIGAAATDFEDVYRIAVSESEDKLSQYYANVKKLQNLFINGIYTRKLLLDTLIMCGERL